MANRAESLMDNIRDAAKYSPDCATVYTKLAVLSQNDRKQFDTVMARLIQDADENTGLPIDMLATPQNLASIGISLG